MQNKGDYINNQLIRITIKSERYLDSHRNTVNKTNTK